MGFLGRFSFAEFDIRKVHREIPMRDGIIIVTPHWISIPFTHTLNFAIAPTLWCNVNRFISDFLSGLLYHVTQLNVLRIFLF